MASYASETVVRLFIYLGVEDVAKSFSDARLVARPRDEDREGAILDHIRPTNLRALAARPMKYESHRALDVNVIHYFHSRNCQNT
jgi:hypothetical protein